MSKAYIVDYLRTPIGKLGGSLSGIRADDLLALVIKSLLARHPKLPLQDIEDVIIGCANQAGEDNRDIARMSALLAGLPITVPGLTVNRLCASGMSAVAIAAQSLKLGIGELFLAGGVEQMTRAPFVLAKAESAFARAQEMFDTSIGWRFVNPRMKELYGVDSMGETAENVARKFGVARIDQDKFAVSSQQKASAARAAGFFAREIIPVELPAINKKESGTARMFEHDEFIREGTSLEALGQLKPAFSKDAQASVTAGNSSGLNDGACVLLLASESAVKKHGLKPKAQILASTQIGVEPQTMGMGPVPATKKVLSQLSLSLKDMAVIELNEAFAAQAVACLRELGLPESDARINPNGGAIALGHPLGMSGARLIGTAAMQLEASGGKYALCTMCVGVGQGAATIIERVS